MEDFEDGLMLAGLVTPSSVAELHEKEMLEEYETFLKKKSEKTDNVFFKRVTLGAEIVSQMYEEPTFGRIKFQKLMYLCENAASMELNDRYLKQVAGPFDNKFMHSVVKYFKDNNWFDVEVKRDGKFKRSVYVPLEKAQDYKKYYDSYFKMEHEKIQYVLDLFRKLKTDKTEVAATLYACAIELKKEQKLLNKSALLEKFYAWSDAKMRFEENLVFEIWTWMREKNVVPE